MMGEDACESCGEFTTFVNSNPFRKELGYCKQCFEAWKSKVLKRVPEWITPKYSKSRVNEAGKALAAGEDLRRDYSADYEVISNWRSAHSVPMKAIHKGLENLVERHYPGSIVARRMKRIPAMLKKLRRLPSMKLSTMQDVVGCRVVLGSVAEVRAFAERFKSKRRAHTLAKEDDYIGRPKASGYRGIHQVYRYVNATGWRAPFSGYSVEVQIRTRLQHAWATAVETVGTFLENSLKSSEGPEEWLRFFGLLGSGFAIQEGTPTVPGTPADRADLLDEIRRLDAGLNIRPRLRAYEKTIHIQESILGSEKEYFLLSLDAKGDFLNISAYKKDEYKEAIECYRIIEEKNAHRVGTEAVLCSVQSINQLRAAYPNYFLDTRAFLAELDQLIG